MPDDPDLTTKHDKIAQRGRAGNTCLRNNDAMPPNDDIMGNLHQIIDLGPLADNRIGQRPAIYSGVGADFHIILHHNPAELRHLYMPARRRLYP